jgi:hypothetical protein
MNLFIGSIFFIFILFLSLSISYYIYTYKSPPKDYLPKQESLSKTTTVGTTTDLTSKFFKTSSSTFMGFIKLSPADRTPNIDGSMSTLINLGNVIALEISPIPGKFYSDSHNFDSLQGRTSTAQLRVITVQNGQYSTEIIPLPSIPLQRWICIGILRDGRRLDVVYDNRIVASKRLVGNFINQAYGPIVVAPSQTENKTKFIGHCIHFFVLPERKTVYEFNDFRARFVNTNNEVILDTMAMPVPGLTFLPSTLPSFMSSLDQPTSPPKNTMKAWSSPYQ